MKECEDKTNCCSRDLGKTSMRDASWLRLVVTVFRHSNAGREWRHRDEHRMDMDASMHVSGLVSGAQCGADQVSLGQAG